VSLGELAMFTFKYNALKGLWQRLLKMNRHEAIARKISRLACVRPGNEARINRICESGRAPVRPRRLLHGRFGVAGPPDMPGP
jgi:hypothetical protein